MNDIVKCYIGNYDGRRNGMVIANSQKAAAKIAECSLYEFRRYWHDGQWPKDFTPQPFVLYTQWMINGSGKWTKGRIT